MSHHMASESMTSQVAKPSHKPVGAASRFRRPSLLQIFTLMLIVSIVQVEASTKKKSPPPPAPKSKSPSPPPPAPKPKSPPPPPKPKSPPPPPKLKSKSPPPPPKPKSPPPPPKPKPKSPPPPPKPKSPPPPPKPKSKSPPPPPKPKSPPPPATHTSFSQTTKSTSTIALPGNTSSTTFNVYEYQAQGNGISDDTSAIVDAWNAACSSYASVATVWLPQNGTFILASNTNFDAAKCNCKSLVFKVDGNLWGPGDKSKWTKASSTAVWMQFTDCTNFYLTGGGCLDARGQSFWPSGNGGPMAIRFLRATNVTVSGITIKNAPQVHLKFNYANGVVIEGITITTPGYAPNADGIHLETLVNNVEILNVTIATGDDCISIQTGTSNVVIRDITCGPGHGISIGALGSGGTVACVSNVTVSNVVFTNTLAGCRIKSWPNGKGSAVDISYSNITVNNVTSPVQIDQFYNSKSTSGSGGVSLAGITFSNVQGTMARNAQYGVSLVCASHGCDGVNIQNVNIKGPNGTAAPQNCVRCYGSGGCVSYGQVNSLSANNGLGNIRITK